MHNPKNMMPLAPNCGKGIQVYSSAMAERPRELEHQTFVMQYDITLTYSMFMFCDRMLSAIKYRILRHQKTRSCHIECANSISVTYPRLRMCAL